MLRLSSYCRIEAASANPIQTGGIRPRTRLGTGCPRPRPPRRAVGIGDDHRSGPLSRVPAHTPYQKPRATSPAPSPAAPQDPIARAGIGPKRWCDSPVAPQSGAPRPRKRPVGRGEGLLDGMVIAAHGRDIPDMSQALRWPHRYPWRRIE
jgi:hypothetical protein